ncbi:MAG: hypothetical protein AVDCRST_MAG85-2384, partial [uncultured Solirubrobacteraceae bacterium]
DRGRPPPGPWPGPARRPAASGGHLHHHGGDRPRGVVHRAGGPVAQAPPRRHRFGVAAAARAAGGLLRVARAPHRVRDRRGAAAGDRDRRPVHRSGEPDRQLRVEPHLRRVLDRLRRGEPAVRQRLPGVQPVAGDRRGAAVPWPEGVSRTARVLARGGRPSRVRAHRAAAERTRRAAQRRHRSRRLHGAHPGRDVALRGAHVGRAGRGVQRLLRPRRPHLDLRGARRACRATADPVGAHAVGPPRGQRRPARRAHRDHHVRRLQLELDLGGRRGRGERGVRGRRGLDHRRPLGSGDDRAARRGRRGRRVLRRRDRRGEDRRRRVRRGRAAQPVRALAPADRRRLRARPLPDAAGLPGPGDDLPRLGPLRQGVGPVRHGGRRDRLRRHQPEPHLVPPGVLRRRRARRRAGAGARPRARHVRQCTTRRPFPVLDALDHDRLHDPRPMAAQVRRSL